MDLQLDGLEKSEGAVSETCRGNVESRLAQFQPCSRRSRDGVALVAIERALRKRKLLTRNDA